MLVDFEFELGGNRYQVVRKRTRGKTGQSELQFRMLDASGNPKPLTEGGVRGTQERILQVLRMDYETFINSAFILQNRADEFARKPPGERKRILGEILNLQAYEELAERAGALAREAASQRAALEGEVARCSQEAEREPERRAAVERLDRDEQGARLLG